MRQKLPKVFIIAILVFTIGAHWTVLQSVAWIGMVVTEAQHCSFKTALYNTLDGKHPCALCKVVQEGKKCANKPYAPKHEIKLDFCLLNKYVCLEPPPPLVLIAAVFYPLAARSEGPPVPPPKSA